MMCCVVDDYTATRVTVGRHKSLLAGKYLLQNASRQTHYQVIIEVLINTGKC